MANNVNAEPLAKAVAAVLWADEKDTPEEWTAAERIFTDNGVGWDEAKPLIERELEALIDEDEDGTAEETDEELEFGVIDVGPGIDTYEVICALALLACSDKELTFQEIDILHRLGEAMNVKKELVAAALIKAATLENVTVAIEEG